MFNFKFTHMKRCIYLITLLLIIGCQDYQRDKEQKAIDNKINQELASGVRNDTIFLGLVFGMSEKEIYSHLNKLKREDKIYLNSYDTYEYEFQLSENSLLSKGQATFSADYFNDRLYKLTVSVESDDIVSSAELIQLSLLKIYASKYGYSYLKVKSILGDTDDYIWINGNRKIELVAGIDDARIFYTDLIAEKEKVEFDNDKAIEKAKEIKGDI